MKRKVNGDFILSLLVIGGLLFAIILISAGFSHLMLKYESGDFPTQFRWAIEGSEKSYSLLDVLYRMAWRICPEGISGVAVVTLVVAMGFLCSALFVKELMPAWKWRSAFLCAFLAFLMEPVFCRPWNEKFVFGVQAGGIWHNPTYLGMKLALPLGLFFLLRIFRAHGRPAFNYLGLAVACTIGTAIKPNFTLCFEVLLGVTMIVFFVRDRASDRRDAFGMLLSMLPSAVILLFQYRINFSGANAESGIGIAPFMILRRYAAHPFLAVVQSIAFSLFVLLVLRKEALKEPIYCFMGGMTILAYLESFLLIETGPRMYDGNWTWGADLCNFGMYLVSLPLFLRYFGRAVQERNKRHIVTGIFGCVLLAWHFLSGVMYLVLVFLNKTVWL